MAKLNGARLQWISVLHLALAVQAAPPQDLRLGTEAAAALAYFPQSELASAGAALARLRPPRLRPELRARIMATLPAEGQLTPSAEERAKLAAADPILAFHDRTGAVEVKLIEVFQAFVGLHGRSVVLVSRPALTVLSAAEVQALVAHELGHDYLWEEYERAAAKKDRRVIRELELRCDGIALLTLRAMKLDIKALGLALAKINRFNARFGTPADVDEYVSDAERARFHEAFLSLCR